MIIAAGWGDAEALAVLADACAERGLRLEELLTADVEGAYGMEDGHWTGDSRGGGDGNDDDGDGWGDGQGFGDSDGDGAGQDGYGSGDGHGDGDGDAWYGDGYGDEDAGGDGSGHGAGDRPGLEEDDGSAPTSALKAPGSAADAFRATLRHAVEGLRDALTVSALEVLADACEGRGLAFGSEVSVEVESCVAHGVSFGDGIGFGDRTGDGKGRGSVYGAADGCGIGFGDAEDPVLRIDGDGDGFGFGVLEDGDGYGDGPGEGTGDGRGDGHNVSDFGDW